MAQDGPVVAFVEVKTRGPGPQAPLEAVTWSKRCRVRRAAERWIRTHPGVGEEFRFDVVGVSESGGLRVAEHVRDAFTGDDA